MRRFFTTYLIFLLSFLSQAQNHSVTKYDLPKKRLLIQVCSMYLYNSNQGAIDADSSVVLACKAYKLPISLTYDEGFNDGNYLLGRDLIANGDINSAKKLLAKAKNEDRIKLSLQLGNFYLFKPGVKSEDLSNSFKNINEAFKLSNQLKIKKWQHQCLLLLGKYYYQANELPQSKKCFTTVIDQCRKQNDKIGLAQALDAQGTLLSNLDPEKEKILQEAVSLYASLGLEEKRLENYMKITTIYFWTGKINPAKKRLYQNLADFRKINFTHEQFGETTIAYIELVQHNINSALYYALKSVKRMEVEEDYTFGDIFYMRLGDVYNTIGHNEDALQLYKKSIEIGQQSINSGTWYKSFFSAVAALSMKGKNKEALDYLNSMTSTYPPKDIFDKMIVCSTKANCYIELKNYGLAEKYFKEMDVYAQQLSGPETLLDVLNAYAAMSAFYADRNQPKKAKYYADKISFLSKSYGRKYSSKNLHIALFKIDSLNSSYISSIKHYQIYKKLNDSLINYSKNKQIEELKIQYETLNKEQKIKLQESELKKSQLLNTVSIWSLVLLLLVIGLLFNRYRLKQRTNAKLELQEKEINQKNINLGHLLDEKEWLLREVHHRVKNNLQTVISLLNSQSAYLDNDKALSAIRNSQHRIHSMSLIHQKLYGTENIATINMPSYIKELVAYLKESFSLGQRIRFEVKVDPLELDVSQAVPLGLILNEAITNSIKYAFPGDAAGFIYVSLEASTDDNYLMTISDNGIGIDTDFTDARADSFGMSLIKGLTDDLEGNFSMENNKGTILRIEFIPELPIDRKYEGKSDIDSENP